MKLFKQSKDGLVEIVEKEFQLEKHLQQLFEGHLEQLTGLQFLATEFSIQGQRFDTLAFDREAKAFVIIEYKRSKHYSVFDQGVSYLHTLLTHRADFLLEYQEKTGETIRRTDIDWSQSKVVFVAPSFTHFQKQAVNFKNLNIDLIEVKQFDDGMIGVEYVSQTNSKSEQQILPTGEETPLNEVTKELKTYTEADLLNGKPDEIIELYEEFKQAIFQLVDDIDLVATKLYMAFKKDNRNLVDIEIQKKQLKLFLNAKWNNLDDPKQIAKDVSNIGHFGNGDYEIKVSDTRDLEYIMSLIKQIK